MPDINPDFPTFDLWLEAVREHAGRDYAYYAEWYSFQTAFEQGMGPLEAVVDCAAWIEQ